MARSSGGAHLRTPEKLAAIAIAILLVVAVAYSGFWFYLANQLRQRVEMLTTRLADDGVVASCGNLAVNGYPFRLGVACDSISAETGNGSGSKLSTASFASFASVLAPGHIVSTLAGPARFMLGDGRGLEANWQSMRATTDFELAGLHGAGLQSEDFEAEFTLFDLSTGRLAAEELGLSARQRGQDLEIAFHATATRLSGTALPQGLSAIDLDCEATLHDSSGFLADARFAPSALRGRSGRLTELRATIPGGAALSLSGPFEISRSGLINGSFEVSVDSFEEWVATLAETFPSRRDAIENANRALGALAGDRDTLSVRLEVREGQASLGFIPIGRIPSI